MRTSRLRPTSSRCEQAIIVCETPPRLDDCRRSSGLLLFLFVALAGCAAMVLFLFDPARYSFYPFCLFYRTTGLQCPGCGSLRALHHLLHGEILQAVRFNALLVLSLPLLAVLALRAGMRWFNPQLRHTPLPSTLVWAAVVLVVIFSVARNLPLFETWFLL